MSTFLAIVAVVAIAGVVLLATGRGRGLQDAPPDREIASLPSTREISSADVDRVRFGLSFRGYRMDQVDEVLERLAGALRDRDDQILELQGLEPSSRGDESSESTRAIASTNPDGQPVDPVDATNELAADSTSELVQKSSDHG